MSREAFKQYADVGRKGVLTFSSFHSAVRSIAHHLYRPSPKFYELFFEKHLLRVAHAEGDKLLAQSERQTVIGYSRSMTLEEELAEYRRPEMTSLIEQNATPLNALYQVRVVDVH